jgi:hypothetical protein
VNTIYKYPIEIKDEQPLSVPYRAVPKFVGLDPIGIPCIWFQVNTDASKVTRTVFLHGTGHPLIPMKSLFLILGPQIKIP